MIKLVGRLTSVGALLLLTNCGVYGPKGNDTGGIIPWSPETQREALTIAQANCASYGKYAAITSDNRRYGDYIAYTCLWRPVHGKYRP